MQIQEILTLIIVITASFAYINHRFIKWPPTIGIMVLSLVSSILLVLLGNSNSFLMDKARQLAASVDFENVLMNFMLSFLLFAGAIHIDGAGLKKERWPIIILASASTIISTFIVGGFTYYIFIAFGINVPFIYCLLFGALISPTDPIAVLGILKQAKIPASLELKISGESLFNDGVAVVIFISIAEVAQSGDFSMLSVTKLFLQEAVGGLLFGAVLGYLGYWALRSIDDYKVEVLITLALVTGGYFLAGKLHISGPLAMVVAGIITGNKVRHDHEGMSAVSRDYLNKFWELIDEILNAVLFLLIGLEMLVIKINPVVLMIGGIMIVIVLLARWVSVTVPVFFMLFRIKFERHAVAILTWGGLRGGISVALALSLGTHMYKDEFVLITYMIVVFSILVQGLTIGPLAKRLSNG
ncbi:sodium:proton antiporter [Mucilaginibacter sp. PAMC 26640]|nr:sodium:proton antiporter [Mucilaginibacter sp. PAMC 26640]